MKIYNWIFVVLLFSIIGCNNEDQVSLGGLELGKDSLFFDAGIAYQKLSLTGEEPTDIVVEEQAREWCSVDRDEEGEIRVHVGKNEIPQLRKAEITFSAQGVYKKLVVVQHGKKLDYEYKDPAGVGDLLIGVDSAQAPAPFMPNLGIENSFDGESTSFYFLRPAAYPFEMVYYLKDAETLDFLVFHGKAGTMVKSAEVWYKVTLEGEYIKLGDYQFDKTDYMVTFPEGIKAPKVVKFVVKSSDQLITCHEVEFKKKAEKGLEAVFTDDTYSELKEGVTLAQIETIQTEFFKNLAYHLYWGYYPLEERVRVYEAYRDPEDIKQEFKFSWAYSKHDNPTGIVVNKGEELLVFVGDTQGQKISLEVMDWSIGFTSVTTYNLSVGVNKLKMMTSGLVYVQYNLKEYKSAQPVKIHIATGKVNGIFDAEKHKKTEWQKMLNRINDGGYLDVMGKYTHIVFPVADYKKEVKDPVALVEAFDEMMGLQYDFMGLFKYNREIKNRLVFCRCTPADAMSGNPHATAYRTAYPGSSYINLADFKHDSWAQAHEAGHMHQTNPGLKWIGMTEVTNNLHSLRTQVNLGRPSRLLGGTYDKALKDLVLAKQPHVKVPDVFCRLVPMWQLYLYSTILGGERADFYKDFHEICRTKAALSTDGARQLDFVRKACELFKLDLTDFFVDMGFLWPIDEMITDYEKRRMLVTQTQIDALKKEIAAAGYPQALAITYLKDDNVDVFKANAAVVKGTVRVAGKVVTFSNWKNAVGYEVWKNGSRVAMSFSNAIEVANAGVFTGAKYYAIAADGTRVEGVR